MQPTITRPQSLKGGQEVQDGDTWTPMAGPRQCTAKTTTIL